MSRTIEVYECDVCHELWSDPATQCKWHNDGDHVDARDRAIVRAALAWVRRIQDPPMLWADEADRALIDAVRANYPDGSDV